MPVSDPRSWTVDELLTEICHSDALYLAAGVSTANVPDGAALERQLRERQMTGFKFLCTFNRAEVVVKNALSIAHLSQRLALADVIDLLRSRSYTHDQQEATTGVRSLDINSGCLPEPLASDHTNITGRKRRKVTPVATAPLPKRPQVTERHTAAPNTEISLEGALVDTESWSHLLRWEREADTDDITDLATEEYLEEDNSEEDDPQDEEDEETEEASSRSNLSQTQVVDIINERIDFYTTSWRPNKDARGEELDYDPVRMWEDAEASGQRRNLAQKHKIEHAYYRQRLDTLCDEIVKFPGRNAVSD